MTAVLTGEVTAEAFLAGVVAALRRHPKARNGTMAEAVAAADRADLSWAQRLALLREHVLGQVPLLLVLDNFDDNLSLEAGTCTIRDPSLIELLTSWADPPHRGRAADHLPAPLCRARGGGAVAGVPSPGAAVPVRRGRAGEVAARARAARRAGPGRGLAAARRSPARHGIPGRAAHGRRRALPGGRRPPRRDDRGGPSGHPAGRADRAAAADGGGRRPGRGRRAAGRPVRIAQRGGAGTAHPGLGLPRADRPRCPAAAGRPVQPGRARQAAGRMPGHRPARRGPG